MKKEKGLKNFNTISNIVYAYKTLFEDHKNYKFLVPLFVFLSIAITILATYLVSFIVLLIENKLNIWLILAYVTGYIFIYILFNVLKNYLQRVLDFGYTTAKATYAFFKMLRHSLAMDYQTFEKKEVREKNRKAEYGVQNDSSGLKGIFHNFPLLVESSLTLLILSIASILISPLILMVVFFSVFLNILIIYFIKKKSNKLSTKNGKIFAKVNYFYSTSEREKDAKDIRNYSLAKKFKSILDEYAKELKRNTFKIELFWLIPKIELNIFSLLRDLLAYAILIYEATNGLISVTEFVALVTTVTTFNTYIDKIALDVDTISQCALEVGYFRDFFEIKGNFNHINKCDLSVLDKPFSIKFNNVSFKYDGSDRYILKDFNLNISSNEKIAIVGINGAGKSTLAKLLCGLYEPTSGEILVNGHSIKDFNINDYYKYVSIVNQEVVPLAFTIKDNIICSRDFDKTKFDDCLEKADFKEKVYSLENKENTYLTQAFDKSGIELSGGEIQKMLLARAIYKDSRLLILDEPTSALDPLAEGKLYEKYNSLSKNKTSIFISHRLSSTRFCDKIYFLENGKIIEEGSHKELMKHKGKYYEMFMTQAKYYKENKESMDI